MSRSPWVELGIAPTADEGAIRRAYAARLKAIDPDAEPERFIALREALAAARRLARQRAAPEPVLADTAPAAATPEEPAPEPAPPPAKPGWVLDIEGIQAAVWSARSRTDIFPEVSERIARILADPAMDSINQAAQIENWAANVIVQGVPRTNAMLAPAINHFGWARVGQQYNCPPLIRQVLDRYADCLFIDRVGEQPGPAGHAYKLLTEPSGRRKTGYDADVVEGFLRGLRAKHPTAIHNLDPATVAEWDAFIAQRRERPVAKVGRWVEANVRAPLRSAWRWCRATRLRALATRILIPFVPALLVWPFDADAAAGFGAMALIYAAIFLAMFIVMDSVRGLKQLFADGWPRARGSARGSRRR